MASPMFQSGLVIPPVDFQLIADSTFSTTGEDVHDNCQEASIYQAALVLAALEVEDSKFEHRSVNEAYVQEKIALSEEYARKLQARVVQMRLKKLRNVEWSLIAS